MRGALRGPAEETKEPMRFCKGKLDDGRPCRIIVIDEADYCRRHQVEIDALVSGAPLPVKRVERPQKEAEVAKYRCAKTNCTRAVKNKDDMCWQHKGLEDQVAAHLGRWDRRRCRRQICFTERECREPFRGLPRNGRQ